MLASGPTSSRSLQKYLTNGVWKKIIEKFHNLQYLKEYDLVDEERIVKPRKASKEDLLLVHTKSYLSSLKVIFEPCLLIKTI